MSMCCSSNSFLNPQKSARQRMQHVQSDSCGSNLVTVYSTCMHGLVYSPILLISTHPFWMKLQMKRGSWIN